jgi:hypothetical protein
MKMCVLRIRSVFDSLVFPLSAQFILFSIIIPPLSSFSFVLVIPLRAMVLSVDPCEQESTTDFAMLSFLLLLRCEKLFISDF